MKCCWCHPSPAAQSSSVILSAVFRPAKRDESKRRTCAFFATLSWPGPRLRSVSNPYPTSRAHRLITGSQNTIHYVAVVIGLARTRSVPNAFDEMTHFRLVAICKRFLGQRPRPAKIDFSFLDDVTRGPGCESGNRSAPSDVGKDGAFRTVDLVSKIKPPFVVHDSSQWAIPPLANLRSNSALSSQLICL